MYITVEFILLKYNLVTKISWKSIKLNNHGSDKCQYLYTYTTILIGQTIQNMIIYNNKIIGKGIALWMKKNISSQN